jgi:hypothetical protein
MRFNRKEIKAAIWLKIATFVGTAIPVVGFIYSVNEDGWSLISASLFGIGVFGTVAVIDVLVSRIVLDDARIEIKGLFRRRSIPRTEISSVTWEKGTCVAMRLKDGKVVKIPNTGHNIQGQATTLRAWVNAQSSGE